MILLFLNRPLSKNPSRQKWKSMNPKNIQTSTYVGERQKKHKPLRDYLGRLIFDLTWEGIVRGVRQYILTLSLCERLSLSLGTILIRFTNRLAFTLIDGEDFHRQLDFGSLLLFCIFFYLLLPFNDSMMFDHV